MQTNKVVNKGLTSVFTVGATIAVGFLSFAGMFVLTSSIIWCCAAFILAAAYEGQVNAEGISSAFRRMFKKNYLKRGIVLQYLEDLDEEEDDSNLFLRDYRLQKKYLDKMNESEHPTEEALEKIAYAEKQIKLMRSFFFRQFVEYEDHKRKYTVMEQAARALIEKKHTQLLTEIARKKWLIRFSWILAIGGGVSSGLAAFSAMKAGIAALSVLSIIPGGVLVSLAVCSAVGYSLLLYQSISDMVQEYSGKWKNYFNKKPEESRTRHVLRCVATVLTIGIAIVATIATAGTWWYATKQGALLFNLADGAASILRSVSVSLMALPAFIFSTSNSLASVDNISRSPYKELFKKAATEINETWRAESFFQFINPFRAVEKVFTYTAKSLLFLGHVISMGLISDRFEAMPAPVCAAANSTGEALTDLNYLPNSKEEHDHGSKLLKVIFFPVTVVTVVLKLLAVAWDAPFSGFKNAWNKIFKEKKVTTEAPEAPTLSEDWRKQKVIEVCNKTSRRLHNKDRSKTSAIEEIKQLASQKGSLREKDKWIREAAQPLASNRFNFWKKTKTQSQQDIDDVLEDVMAGENSKVAYARL